MADFTDMLKGLVSLGYNPDTLNLNEFMQVFESPRLNEASANTAPKQTYDNNPKFNQEDYIDIFSGPPLTEDEARQVDDKINDVLAALNATEKRLKDMISRVDSEAAGGLDNTADGEFSVTIQGRRPRLLRIIKKVFGTKTRVITYSMYKAAMETKRMLEEQQVEEYTSEEAPEFSDDEEEDDT
jgi:hypothetical protein